MMPQQMMQMQGFGGGGAIAYPGHSAAMYGGAGAGQMMEKQMMASHQARHGQALPVSFLVPT
jgi:hypothetical protein